MQIKTLRPKWKIKGTKSQSSLKPTRTISPLVPLMMVRSIITQVSDRIPARVSWLINKPVMASLAKKLLSSKKMLRSRKAQSRKRRRSIKMSYLRYLMTYPRLSWARTLHCHLQLRPRKTKQKVNSVHSRMLSHQCLKRRKYLELSKSKMVSSWETSIHLR